MKDILVCPIVVYNYNGHTTILPAILKSKLPELQQIFDDEQYAYATIIHIERLPDTMDQLTIRDNKYTFDENILFKQIDDYLKAYDDYPVMIECVKRFYRRTMF